MRTARIRVDDCNTWYHCFNRVAGTRQSRPFGPVEKEKFIRILHEVSELFGIKVVAYQVMSNHYHLLLHAPVDAFSAEEVCRRYTNYHRGKKVMQTDSIHCRVWQKRLRDISWFLRLIQQRFSSWYNKTRSVRRYGILWANRFRHSILEPGQAVWSCLKYIEKNATRAGLVKKARDYRFGSYGLLMQSGTHPFESNVKDLLLPMLGLIDMAAFIKQMTNEIEEAGGPEPIPGQGRFCCWMKGIIVGSELFVRTTLSRYVPWVKDQKLPGPDKVSDRLEWLGIQTDLLG